MNIYQLEVLRFDDLGHLPELEIVRLQKDTWVEIIITIVNDEIGHGQDTVVAHGIGGSRWIYYFDFLKVINFE